MAFQVIRPDRMAAILGARFTGTCITATTGGTAMASMAKGVTYRRNEITMWMRRMAALSTLPGRHDTERGREMADEYGKCAECGQLQRLTTRGNLYQHQERTPDGTCTGKQCGGVGKPPKQP